MTENGRDYIKRLASFLRRHKSCLSGSPLLNTRSQSIDLGRPPTIAQKTANVLGLGFTPSSQAEPGSYTLSLTLHHSYYLISQFIDVLKYETIGRNIRIESVSSSSSISYASFLNGAQLPFSHHISSDRDSISSVSTIRSTISTLSTFIGEWTTSRRREGRPDKSQIELARDLQEIYEFLSSTTSIQIGPSIDGIPHLIKGYEQFPFDRVVSILPILESIKTFELTDTDARAVFGWDELADRIHNLSLRNVSIADPAVVIVELPYDDARANRVISPQRDGPYVPPLDNSALAAWLQIPDFDRAQDEEITGDRNTVPLTASSPAQSYQSPIPSYASNSSLYSPWVAQAPRFSPAINMASSPQRRPTSASFARSVLGDSHTLPGSLPHGMRRPSTTSLSGSSRISGATYLAASTVPLSKWQKLLRLRMSGCGFTNISSCGLLPLANSLNWLDLSSNLFTTVPATLAILTKLTDLDLSNCQISCLQPWYRYPIRSLQCLNLAQNKLRDLKGIETLHSLKIVYLNNNSFTRPQDLAPLTSLPDIERVVVTGNPFTKSHKNYRVIIFNLFRSTPGYKTDIKIDSMGPTSTELRDLKDQVGGVHPTTTLQLSATSSESTDAAPATPPSYLSYEDIEKLMDEGKPPRRGHLRSRSDMGLLNHNVGSKNNSMRRRMTTRPTIGVDNPRGGTRPSSGYYESARSPAVPEMAPMDFPISDYTQTNPQTPLPESQLVDQPSFLPISPSTAPLPLPFDSPTSMHSNIASNVSICHSSTVVQPPANSFNNTLGQSGLMIQNYDISLKSHSAENLQLLSSLPLASQIPEHSETEDDTDDESSVRQEDESDEIVATSTNLPLALDENELESLVDEHDCVSNNGLSSVADEPESRAGVDESDSDNDVSEEDDEDDGEEVDEDDGDEDEDENSNSDRDENSDDDDDEENQSEIEVHNEDEEDEHSIPAAHIIAPSGAFSTHFNHPVSPLARRPLVLSSSRV